MPAPVGVAETRACIWVLAGTNSADADPSHGDVPRRRLLPHWLGGEIVAPDDLRSTPDWAKPILAAALKIARPRR